MDYGSPETLEVELRPDAVLHVRLNRPDVHNAFNETVIEELRSTFATASGDRQVRAVLLTGNGKSFSAGADIHWMREQGAAGHDANVAGANRMAQMFHAIYTCSKPVLAAVHGAALGGDTGLAAVADITLAADTAKFGFTEVRLGIIPAVISPYVVEKLGTARARAAFLLGNRFDGQEAERLGLVFRSCAADVLDEEVERTISEVLRGGPGALAEAKKLTHALAARRIEEDLEMTAEAIARVRGTAEAQEGLAAFLEKRKTTWSQTR